MVRTEADEVVHQVDEIVHHVIFIHNHRHNNHHHHQNVLYEIFNMNFPMRKNRTLSIKKTTSKMRLTMERWLTRKAISRWSILILIGEEDFLFLIMIGEDKTQVLMNIG